MRKVVDACDDGRGCGAETLGLAVLANAADEQALDHADLKRRWSRMEEEEDGDTSSTEHICTRVVDYQACFPARVGTEPPAVERRKRSRHSSQPSASDALQHRVRRQRSSTRRSSPRAVGAKADAMDSFASFASMYREQLRFADEDEAEAVFGMVSLTQAKPLATGARTDAEAGRCEDAMTPDAEASHTTGSRHTARLARKEDDEPCGSEGASDSSTSKSLHAGPPAKQQQHQEQQSPHRQQKPQQLAVSQPASPQPELTPPAGMLAMGGPMALPFMPPWGATPWGAMPMFGMMPPWGMMQPPMMAGAPMIAGPPMAPWSAPPGWPSSASSGGVAPGAAAFMPPPMPGMMMMPPWMAHHMMPQHMQQQQPTTGAPAAPRPVLGHPILRPAVMGLPVTDPAELATARTPTPSATGTLGAATAGATPTPAQPAGAHPPASTVAARAPAGADSSGPLAP